MINWGLGEPARGNGPPPPKKLIQMAISGPKNYLDLDLGTLIFVWGNDVFNI
jgi:hypothetical protein